MRPVYIISMMRQIVFASVYRGGNSMVSSDGRSRASHMGRFANASIVHVYRMWTSLTRQPVGAFTMIPSAILTNLLMRVMPSYLYWGRW